MVSLCVPCELHFLLNYIKILILILTKVNSQNLELHKVWMLCLILTVISNTSLTSIFTMVIDKKNIFIDKNILMYNRLTIVDVMTQNLILFLLLTACFPWNIKLLWLFYLNNINSFFYEQQKKKISGVFSSLSRASGFLFHRLIIGY